MKAESPVVAALVRLMKTKRVFTSAYQPSTNGMVERCHKWINSALRIYASLSPTDRDWETSLKIAEFAYRTSTLTGTELTPFYVIYGRHPIFPQDALNAQGMPKTRALVRIGHVKKNTELLQGERDPEPLRLDLGLEAGPMQGVPTAHQAGGAQCWLNPLSNRITILINI